MNSITNKYFDWLYQIATDDMFASDIFYRRLLMELHSIPFEIRIPNDKNRAEDGLALRFRFGLEERQDFNQADLIAERISEDIDKCTVLEMMVGLALRCEETIMDNPQIGDRSTFWFWKMVSNLHLSDMTDERFDRKYVDERIDILLDRTYGYDGDGGLFTVPNTKKNMRDVEIWIQLLMYLDTIT